MMKRALTILISTSLLILSATPALAAAGAAPALAVSRANVNLQTTRTAAIVEGDTAWIALSWTAKKADVTDFRVVAKTRTAGVTISYPDNTGTYTSLMNDSTLSAGEIDFSSLRVSVPYGARRVILVVNATWIDAAGVTQSMNYKAQIPVAGFIGDDIAQLTDNAGPVPVKAPTWLGVEWTGIAPSLNKVQMTVSGPAGIAISYPENTGKYTSLHYDDTLEDGETDIAKFLVDASAITPGKYTLDVVLTYTKGTESKAVKGQVSFEVTG